MKQQDDIQEELQTQAPFLAKLGKKEYGGFQVPEHYFEHASAEVLVKVKAIPKEAATGRVQTLSNRNILSIKWGIGIAASLLIVVAAFFAIRQSSEKTMIASYELSEGDAESYILSNLDDFQEELLLIHTKTVQDSSAQTKQLDQYLDYLLEEVDVKTLEEFL